MSDSESLEMDPEIKRKWVEALRSGEYEQTSGLLRTSGNKFCCLGVLWDLKGDGWGPISDTDGPRRPYTMKGKRNVGCAFLSDNFEKRVGLSFGTTAELMGMNDSGKTFDEIADWIEKEL